MLPSITHTPVTKAVSGSPVQLRATTNDDEGIKGVLLYYRAKTGEMPYRIVEMVKGSDSYTEAIPKEFISSFGIRYYLTSIDNSGNRKNSDLVDIQVDDKTGPEITGNFTIASQTGEFAVKWNSPADVDVAGYKIYLGDTPNSMTLYQDTQSLASWTTLKDSNKGRYISVSFDTQGTIGDISFDYGDGTTGKVLSHIYTQPGTYKVVLTATGISGYKTLTEKTVTVTQSPCVAVANFTVQPENGQAPLTISLNTDGSTGELSFDYGDGTTGKELSHTYTQAGTYTITLTETGTGGCKNTMQKTISVAAPCVAVAKFKATPTSGTVPFTVSFDASESQGQTYEWNFGDSSSATGQIQSHAYLNAGIYAVVLTVKGTGGCANSANMAIEALAVSKPTITMTSEREFQAGNYKEPPAKVIWEIFTDTMTVFRTETAGLSLKLPELFLNKDTDYQCRMMSVDSKGNLSAWSEPLTFRVSTPDAGIQTGALKIETVNRNDTMLSLKYFDSSHAVFAQDRKSVAVEIRDGGFGDADGVENGVIVSSPSGYGTSVKTPTDTVVPPSQPVLTDDGGGGGCFINSLFNHSRN